MAWWRRSKVVEPEVARFDETLDELLRFPEVAAAWADMPDPVAQVSFLDQFEDGAWPKAEFAQYVLISRDSVQVTGTADWTISFADEAYANLDLDIEDDDDPLLDVLRADPAVTDAWHDNREVYTAVARADMPEASFAALAVRAIVAHHQAVRDR